MKKELLTILAIVIDHMAVKASGDASYFGYHQPKEPAALKNAVNCKKSQKV
jgi:hypothetical protein